MRTFHDVVSVGDEPDTDGQRHDGDLPQGNGVFSGAGGARGPGGVHGGPDTDSVTNVVGTVGERRGASGDDLDVGV